MFSVGTTIISSFTHMYLQKSERRMIKLINWKVRFKNGPWVAAFISQIVIVVEIVLTGLNMMGITHIHLTDAVKNYILSLANAVFVLLSMLGIVQDPTTKGYGDSEQALKYESPK